MKLHNRTIIVFFALVVLDLAVWGTIFAARPGVPAIYFLDVGQGDSELVVFPGNVKMITDAGPDQKIIKSLEGAIPGERYIDLAVVSHVQKDHFGGFNDVLKRYRIGAFIVNGRTDAEAEAEWSALMGEIERQNIPLIVLGAGDAVRFGEARVDILSPDKNWVQSGESNDTGLVEKITLPLLTALFTADAGFEIEKYLLASGIDLRADILKVGHHGSKYSSSEEFLAAVRPAVAAIEVGKNTYGHPAPETLARLARFAGNVFRTDRDGNIKIEIYGRKLKVLTERSE
ncbi:MAG: ComE operon protein 3 [Parcubacteria group bacterium GW2011_GWA1_50_14]|uniref:Metallo-beta-lactamase domain-containing protein n=1 Tax=Candidatus Liptonbacteria bacterium GWB1_49_6 TaxID=1798644 RepID=A0A1G2C5K1_9BACT|nr:MAG: ComE operon protein 3 [Parcubacteria group bacterium GW2011_GWA1_50_14]OGY96664.1 MAG: hypothetical protein A2122_00550 [Candidatus Liptonbacteria bacterium GWB1_49_6]